MPSALHPRIRSNCACYYEMLAAAMAPSSARTVIQRDRVSVSLMQLFVCSTALAAAAAQSSSSSSALPTTTSVSASNSGADGAVSIAALVLVCAAFVAIAGCCCVWLFVLARRRQHSTTENSAADGAAHAHATAPLPPVAEHNGDRARGDAVPAPAVESPPPVAARTEAAPSVDAAARGSGLSESHVRMSALPRAAPHLQLRLPATAATAAV